ncbi:MAG TPA: hypothetical protein VF064_16820 [Pyrinomonadaceae bacterium]
MSSAALAAAGVTAAAAYVYTVRPWHLKWGATEEETSERLPGDELVPRPNVEATHAVTIEAPVKDVWPWLVQIGQDKGGFYSYTWLENLVGCHMRNAGRIMPECQQLGVGDSVRLHPKAPPLPVLICEPPRALVLGSNTDSPGTWGFYLKEVDEDTTRLVVRGRGEWKPGLLSWLGAYVVFEPAHFIMERKMLLGIKQRAEALRQCVGAGSRRRVRVAGEQW